MVLIGVFITALYSFRMFFLVFHGKGPRDEHAKHHIKESPKVVTVPLILLAIPSVVIGWLTVGPMLFEGFLGNAIHVIPKHDVLAEIGEHYHGPWSFVVHGVQGWAFWLALSGFLTAWFVYMMRPQIADQIKSKLGWLHKLLDKKYWVDEVYLAVFGGGSRGLGKVLWFGGDRAIIDGLVVDGSAKSVKWIAGVVRYVQTGYLFHYAVAMILGLLLLLTWFVVR